MKKAFLSILVFLCGFSCIGNPDSLLAKKSNGSSKVDSNRITEAQAYKMLYENQMRADDAIRETVIYALEALGLAVALIIGSNIWFNIREVRSIKKGIDSKIEKGNAAALSAVKDQINSLSKEKTKEINEMKTKLQEEVTANITSLTGKYSEFTGKIREDIKKDNIQLSTILDERIKSYSDNLLSQIKTLETLANERSETMNKSLTLFESTFTGKLDTTENKMAALKEEMYKNIGKMEKELRTDIYRDAGYMWETRKVLSNALTSFISEGEINLELGNSGMVRLSLYDVSRILRLMKNDKYNLSEYEYNNLIKYIDSLPSEYLKDVTPIKQLANECYKPTK